MLKNPDRGEKKGEGEEWGGLFQYAPRNKFSSSHLALSVEVTKGKFPRVNSDVLKREEKEKRREKKIPTPKENNRKNLRHNPHGKSTSKRDIAEAVLPVCPP